MAASTKASEFVAVMDECIKQGTEYEIALRKGTLDSKTCDSVIKGIEHLQPRLKDAQTLTMKHQSIQSEVRHQAIQSEVRHQAIQSEVRHQAIQPDTTETCELRERTGRSAPSENYDDSGVYSMDSKALTSQNLNSQVIAESDRKNCDDTSAYAQNTTEDARVTLIAQCTDSEQLESPRQDGTVDDVLPWHSGHYR